MKLPPIDPSALKGPSGFLDQPGTYHLLVENLKVGLNSKDEPFNGTTVEVQCLGGSVAGQEQKKVSLTLWDIDASKPEDEQKQTVKRLWAFYIATNVLQPADMQSGDVDFDEKLAIDNQLVVKLQHKQKKFVENGKAVWRDDPSSRFLEIAYADIFHVDDPDVASVPKNADAIAIIPKKHRHEQAWFEYKIKATGGTSAKADTSVKKSDYSDDDDF
jgi:hypothetical protein